MGSHNGVIPNGYVVRFKNGNTIDCRIDNLELVSRAEHATRCRWDPASEYTLITGRSARQYLKKQGVPAKQITPEMMTMARMKVLITNKKRKK